MNFTGLLVGLSTFLIIGLFHPLVIKAEYYLGIKSWILFAIAGVIFGIASILVSHLIWSTILGVVAFSSFWSILEVVHQRERVRKGWFPEGPGHKKYTSVVYLDSYLGSCPIFVPASKTIARQHGKCTHTTTYNFNSFKQKSAQKKETDRSLIRLGL